MQNILVKGVILMLVLKLAPDLDGQLVRFASSCDVWSQQVSLRRQINKGTHPGSQVSIVGQINGLSVSRGIKQQRYSTDLEEQRLLPPKLGLPWQVEIPERERFNKLGLRP